MDKMFFDSWDSIVRTLIITVLAYAIMVIMLRVSGKRTLSKMNAFDFIITVALGSTLATVALNKDVALADGALAFFLLIFLQYAITWLSVRVKSVKRTITSQPALLLYKGKLLRQVLKKERITEEEIFFSVRKAGIADLSNIDVIVLESTGVITVISDAGSSETLENVNNFPLSNDS